MKFKNRMILSKVITVLCGACALATGCVKGTEALISIGAAMLAVGIVNTIRLIRMLRNPEKLKSMENAYRDERNIFVAGKSYTFAFWASVYTEFLAVIVLSFAEKEEYAMIFSLLVCFQVFIYAGANIFYHKKY